VGYVDLGSAISASFSEPLVKTGEANFYRFPVPSREVSRFFITCITFQNTLHTVRLLGLEAMATVENSSSSSLSVPYTH